MAFNPRVLRGAQTPRFGAGNPAGFSSSRRFNKMFKQMLGKKALVKNPRGLDRARGLGQAKAAVAGRNNIKRTPLTSHIDPIAAAMQHAVRNRAVEQGANALGTTAHLGTGFNSATSVLRFLKGA